MQFLRRKACGKIVTKSEILVYLDILERDLRNDRDRSKDLYKLYQLSSSSDIIIRQRVSWCIAKMGQNKVSDVMIVNILSLMKNDSDPYIRENVAWGIGEIAGAYIGNNNSVSTVLYLMSDCDDNVRAMASWAAGRLRHKLKIDAEITKKLRDLKNDSSSYVRKCVDFALNDENVTNDH